MILDWKDLKHPDEWPYTQHETTQKLPCDHNDTTALHEIHFEPTQWSSQLLEMQSRTAISNQETSFLTDKCTPVWSS